MKATFKKGMSRRLIDALSTAGINRGIGPSHRYLLTVAGRKTKMQHTTPVSLVRDGSISYLVAPYGEVEWVKNARAAGQVTLARGGQGKTYSVAPVQAKEGAEILKRYIALEPITRPYFDAGSSDPAEAFVADLPSHPVFRLTPIS